MSDASGGGATDVPDLTACARRLASFPAVLTALLDEADEAATTHKPAAEHWSILEGVRHLLAKEGGDFRERLRLTLHDPDQPWPAIEPEKDLRAYADLTLAGTLAAFVKERAESVAWLQSLDAAKLDWTTPHPHPQHPTSAGDLLASWLAHDMLHLRQIARRLHETSGPVAGGFDSAYAGRMN